MYSDLACLYYLPFSVVFCIVKPADTIIIIIIFFIILFESGTKAHKHTHKHKQQIKLQN